MQIKPQWNITSLWSKWPSSKSLQTINAGGGVKKWECSCTVGGNVNWYSHDERWYDDSLKNYESNHHMTQDGDCSHEIKRHLLLGRKVMTNLDSMFKSRDIALPTKVRLVKAMVFPVIMYGCESWIVKKAEHRRIDAFELWCWRRLLRIPWTARRCNQSIVKEISSGISLEGMMLKLKLQYFGHLMRRVDSLEKSLMLGGIAGKRRRGRQRMRWLDGITDLLDVSLSELWELVMDRRPGVLWFMGSQRVRHDWTTDLIWFKNLNYLIFSWYISKEILYMCLYPYINKNSYLRRVSGSLYLFNKCLLIKLF